MLIKGRVLWVEFKEEQVSIERVKGYKKVKKIGNKKEYVGLNI